MTTAIAERWHLREVGLWMFLGTLVMLFAAFTSALVVRQSSGDWVDIPLPFILWINTAVIGASSLTLEWARRAGRSEPRRAMPWVSVTAVLGLVFLTGQIQAWRALAAAGLYVPTTPAASFFYVLTGLHAAHLAAALACLAYLLARTVSPRAGEWPYLASTVATFWHFLAVVWLYLMVLLEVA
jgi:cytochrome c oxidase subunit 3